MRPLVGTSTKMNLTSTEARTYLQAVRGLVEPIIACDLFVLPPFTAIWVARECLAGSNVAWGAQDVHHEEAGAHTGDVSAPMLVDLGCTYAEIGHSERRRDHGETDALAAAKVRQALRYGLTPILCIGEPTRRTTPAAIELVLAQLRIALDGLAPADRSRVVVAYEPVWAIGVGSVPAEPAHVGLVQRAIHDQLRADGARGARVVYGGSVDPATAGAILAEPGVDGLFVGRSALDPGNFAAVARIAQDQVSSACAARPPPTANA